VNSACVEAELTPVPEDYGSESAGKRPLAFEANPFVMLKSVRRVPVTRGGHTGSTKDGPRRLTRSSVPSRGSDGGEVLAQPS
jgi:hypothetical protein